MDEEKEPIPDSLNPYKVSKIELTEDQKTLILAEWNNRPENPPSIPELIKLCWPEKEGKDLDSRTFFGRAIRSFLASRQIKVKKAGEYTPMKPIELTSEQKEYIKNNCNTMKCTEIAEALFNVKGQTNLSRETRAVVEHMKTLETKVKLYQPLEDIPEGKYSPPKSLSRVLVRLNKYRQGQLELSEENLKDRQKKDCYTLIAFLHNFRFVHQINTYDDESDRELMESAYIEYIWGKPDLTPEELDQYAVVATEKVIAANILKQINKLQKLLNNVADDEDKKISISLVEAITSARNEYNQCINRQERILKALTGTRSERLGGKLRENATILNLVNEWKNEDSRKQMIALAEKQKELLKKEIGRLSSMEDIKAKIFGISEEEVLNS